MAQPDWSAALPGNLSRKAVEDLVRILRRSSREFGVAIARQSRERLIARIRAIETGAAIGHPRADVPSRRPILFLNEEPWVICFNPNTRHVYRIVHGARDFPSLFGR